MHPEAPDASPTLSRAAMRPRPDLLVCEGCDAVYRRAELRAGDEARCVRCHQLLGRGHRLTAEGHLALAVASLICFVMGNLAPIVTLDLRGLRSAATLLGSIRLTWAEGEQLVAVLAAATAFGFPLFVILLRLYVLTPLAFGRRPADFTQAMRLLGFVQRWSMVEVFMLGILIAVVRSAGLASAEPGVGLFSFAALTVLLAANQAAGIHGIWSRASECRG